MVNLQSVLAFPFLPFQWTGSSPPSITPTRKSFAIIGGGSSGLAALEVLRELQDPSDPWDIVLLEQRHDVGGIWLPDNNKPEPPAIPKTPLYPLLNTNTPVPSMTYPSFPFPPGTPLYPTHEHIRAYHRRYAEHFNLIPHIQFNHTADAARWVGDEEAGHWDLLIGSTSGQSTRTADHLIVATGNNHYPHIPVWQGQDLWLAKDTRRQIMHAAYYTTPDRYANKTVVVVGGRASALDIVTQVSGQAAKTYLSSRSTVSWEPEGPITYKGDIANFTEHAIWFSDGTSANADVVILGTGYENVFPFLEAGEIIRTDPSARRSSDDKALLLHTNTRYVFPLHEHILSLASGMPVTALAFIGLPVFVANCPSDRIQSLFAVYTMLNPSLLPPRSALLAQLDAREDWIRAQGEDPYKLGHRQLTPGGHEYQDGLWRYLQTHGAVPDDGVPYVEAWRKRATKAGAALKRGWQRIERLGTQGEWLAGVETEEEWADLQDRIARWQINWEEGQGISITKEQPVFP
ncbi:dimethylaniline monooxygenase [Mycena vitilis]|nr:dimethylaniline monooxygenase [Mycena vitilis]